jgi:hypothetical protein
MPDAWFDDVESFVGPRLPPATALELGAADGRMAERLVARGCSVKTIG